MRAAGRAMGRHLASTVGFRGGFSLDGVLTSHGWLPTEVNPRFAAGLATIGTVEIGPAAMGVIARFRPATGAIRIGERAAQYASALLDFADREYGTDFGPCLPAPDPR